MLLTKPKDYKEVPALQNGETVYAQDHNQIIANIEQLKGDRNNNIMCGLEFQGNAGTTYNIDWVLPKQI